jgi:hypothetical protein
MYSKRVTHPNFFFSNNERKNRHPFHSGSASSWAHLAAPAAPRHWPASPCRPLPIAGLPRRIQLFPATPAAPRRGPKSRAGRAPPPPPWAALSPPHRLLLAADPLASPSVPLPWPRRARPSSLSSAGLQRRARHGERPCFPCLPARHAEGSPPSPASPACRARRSALAPPRCSASAPRRGDVIDRAQRGRRAGEELEWGACRRA